MRSENFLLLLDRCCCDCFGILVALSDLLFDLISLGILSVLCVAIFASAVLQMVRQFAVMMFRISFCFRALWLRDFLN